MGNTEQYEAEYLSFLVSLHDRPGFYIGIPSLEKLFIFMAGYEVAIYKLTGYRVRLQHNLYDFLCKKILKYEPNSSLFQIIQGKKSDKESFDYFFHVLNLYKEQINQSGDG